MKYKIKKDVMKQLLSISKKTARSNFPKYALLIANNDGIICDVKLLKKTHGCTYAPGVNSAMLTAEYVAVQKRKLRIVGVYVMPASWDQPVKWTARHERSYINRRRAFFSRQRGKLFMINKTCYNTRTIPFTKYIPRKTI